MAPTSVIHVIDDDDAVRNSLVMLLEVSGFAAAGYPSASQFLKELPTAAPGCIVSDIRMPGVDGLQLQRLLAEQRADFPFIVITGHADLPMAIEALKNGAAAFIEKPFSDESLLTAIRSCLDADLRFETRQSTDALKALSILTTHEQEIVSRLVDGQPNKSIAADLGIGIHDLEVARATIMQKTKSRVLSDLVRLMLQATDCAERS